MSLLLLFNGGGVAPSADLTVEVDAGSDVAIHAAKGLVVSLDVGSGGDVSITAVKNADLAIAPAGSPDASALALNDGVHASVQASAGAGVSIAISGRHVTGLSVEGSAGSGVAFRAVPLRVGIPLSRLNRVVIYTDPTPVTFTEQGTDSAYPLLASVGTIRIAARAGTVSGLGSNETTSVTVSIDNRDFGAIDLVGRPIRKRIEIYRGEELFFAGLITSSKPGRTLDLTAQS